MQPNKKQAPIRFHWIEKRFGRASMQMRDGGHGTDHLSALSTTRKRHYAIVDELERYDEQRRVGDSIERTLGNPAGEPDTRQHSYWRQWK